MKLLFDCHCQNLKICAVKIEAPFYNQTTLVYKQIVSPSLLFHVNGASWPATLFSYSRDEKGRQLAIER